MRIWAFQVQLGVFYHQIFVYLPYKTTKYLYCHVHREINFKAFCFQQQSTSLCLFVNTLEKCPASFYFLHFSENVFPKPSVCDVMHSKHLNQTSPAAVFCACSRIIHCSGLLRCSPGLTLGRKIRIPTLSNQPRSAIGLITRVTAWCTTGHNRYSRQ